MVLLLPHSLFSAQWEHNNASMHVRKLILFLFWCLNVNRQQRSILYCHCILEISILDIVIHRISAPSLKENNHIWWSSQSLSDHDTLHSLGTALQKAALYELTRFALQKKLCLFLELILCEFQDELGLCFCSLWNSNDSGHHVFCCVIQFLLH